MVSNLRNPIGSDLCNNGTPSVSFGSAAACRRFAVGDKCDVNIGTLIIAAKQIVLRCKAHGLSLEDASDDVHHMHTVVAKFDVKSDLNT